MHFLIRAWVRGRYGETTETVRATERKAETGEGRAGARGQAVPRPYAGAFGVRAVRVGPDPSGLLHAVVGL